MLDFIRFQDNNGSLWTRLKDGGGMPELQSVAEDMIADALAHPKPAAARQTTAASRKEDGPHEEFFQRDATNFHIDLDAMSTLVVCACCGEERGSHEFTDKTYEADCALLAPLQGSLVRARVRAESVAGAHLGVQGGVLVSGSRVILSGLMNTTFNGSSGMLEEFDESTGRWRVKLDTGVFKNVKPANVDSDLTPLQPLRLCLDCQKLLSKGKKPVNADFRFYSPDPRLMELSELERRLIFPVNPSMRIFRLLADGQYGTSGGSVIHINDCLRVAQKLPRLPTNADVLFVRQSGQSRAQLEKMVKIRPNHLRNLLREVRTPASCPAAELTLVCSLSKRVMLLGAALRSTRRLSPRSCSCRPPATAP